MSIETIVQMIYAAAVLIFFVCTVIARFAKGKPKEVAESILNVINVDKLLELIKEAETFKNYSAKEKLNYVLVHYQIDSMQNGEPFNAEEVEKEIEKLIDFSKNVNAKEQEEE